MPPELRSNLAALQQQVASIEAEIATREAPLRAPQRALEAARDALATEVSELEARRSRFAADGRGEAPSPPALSAIRVTGFALSVGCLVAGFPALGDDGPRALVAALLLTFGAGLGGFFRAR